MSLDKIIDDMAAYAKTKLVELKTSEMAGGRINLEEVCRRSMALPAGFFACTGTRDGRWYGNVFRTRGLFLLVLIVRSNAEGQATPQDRAHAIARFAGRAIAVVAGAGTWGNDEVASAPEKVSSSNPYTTAADKNNVAVWGITWEQQLALTGVPEPLPLDDFLLLDAKYQITPSNPEIDAEDHVVLEGGQP